jgi:transposase-like protein
MAKQHRSIIRYSISFKQQVVKEIEEEGLSYEDAKRRYGIKGGETIQKWLKDFGKNHLIQKVVRVEMKGEKDRVKELEAEIKKLKSALADSALENYAMKTLIDVVNEHYGTDVKKNLGPLPSKGEVKRKDIL